MEKSSLMSSVRSFFSENKLLLTMLGLVCFLGYGFTITHQSIGIDNTAYDVYFTYKGVVGQGRVTQLLLDMVFGSYKLSPFWANALGVLILYFSAVTWSFLFKRVGKEKISKGALIIFAVAMVSHPMINEHFIFMPLNFAICYMLTAMSIIGIYEAYQSKRIALYLIPILLMIFVVSLNESFMPVFLCGIFFILIIEYMTKEMKETSFKTNIIFFLISIAVLMLSIGIESMITLILKKTMTYHSTGAGNVISWFNYPISYTIKTLVIGFLYRYILAALWYFPVTLLLISGVIGTIIAIMLSIKNKRLIILVLMLGLFLSVISLHLINGHILPYRANASFAVFIGFILMITSMIFKPKWLKICYGIIMVILIVNQTRILNSWFVNDYNRYEKDREIAVNTALMIEKEHDETKPIVFVGETAMAPQVEKVSANGRPIIGWSIVAFDNRATQLHNFLLYHGHKLNQASESQYADGRAVAQNMPSYPDKGYIKELKGYIVVNFGDNYKWVLDEREEKAQEKFLNGLEKITGLDREYLEGQLATSIN